MAVLQAEQLGDLVAATLNELGEMKFTEIATDLQDHTAMRMILNKNRVTIDAGPQVSWRVLVNHSSAASNVGLFAADNVNVTDGLVEAKTPWRHTTTNYAIDGREVSMNASPRKIVDLLKERRIMCMISLAELMEGNFWDAPSSSDTVTPYGLPYWITKNATTGFNGGTLSGFSDVANLNTTTYPRWNNYTYQYTDVSKDDFVRGARAAHVKCGFRPPVDGVPTFNTGDRFGMFTNYTVLSALEEILEAQNENLGKDVASMDGQVMFRRTPVVWVPKLDADTTDPFYGINWGVFKTYILRGWWLKETNISVTPGQHTVASVHVDCSYQFICKDRRRCFVLATGTTYP